MSTLRVYRKAHGRSLEEMAALLGVSVSSLSRIERGEQWPDRQFFERLREVTNGEVLPNDVYAAPSASGTEAAA